MHNECNAFWSWMRSQIKDIETHYNCSFWWYSLGLITLIPSCNLANGFHQIWNDCLYDAWLNSLFVIDSDSICCHLQDSLFTSGCDVPAIKMYCNKNVFRVPVHEYQFFLCSFHTVKSSFRSCSYIYACALTYLISWYHNS